LFTCLNFPVFLSFFLFTLFWYIIHPSLHILLLFISSSRIVFQISLSASHCNR
jgi:hypothetical protein